MAAALFSLPFASANASAALCGVSPPPTPSRRSSTRASKGAFLNLSEGLPSESGPVRRRFFTTAAGSACETAAAVDLAALGEGPDALPGEDSRAQGRSPEHGRRGTPYAR
jgi:hypothetical protein